MIAERLRKAVLQAAIQGKLTEQRPEDGDARELLVEIKAEKKRLIKEGKMKRQKPLPEITEDEIPFEIPENWCWVRLGEIGEIVGGGTPKTSDMKNWLSGTIPWITPADMRNVTSKYITRGARFITEHGLNTSSAQLMPKGSVLFSSRAPIGYVAIASNELCTNQGFKSVVPFLMSLNLYLYYCLIGLRDEIEKKGTGTTFKEVSGTVMASVIVPLCPPAEQQRIVAKLEEVLPQIDKLQAEEEALAKLQEEFPQKLKNSLLQAAIQGKLTVQWPEDGDARELMAEVEAEKERLTKEGKIKKQKLLPEIVEDEIPFEIPENWCWVRMGDVGETNVGLTYKPIDVSSSGTLVLRSSNIQNEQIDYADCVYVTCEIPENKICKLGDILICARNGSKRLVGKAAIIDRKGMSFGAFMAIFRSCFNEYIHKYISTPYFREDLDGVGTTTINQITQANLRMRLVPFPPLAEQQRIVAKLEELLPLCDALAVH